jgi:hypothetical protein
MSHETTTANGDQMPPRIANGSPIIITAPATASDNGLAISDINGTFPKMANETGMVPTSAAMVDAKPPRVPTIFSNG